MANAVEKTTKDGKRFYELRAYCSAKKQYYTTRWYVPEGWGSRSIQNELNTQLVNFQNAVNAGEVLSKKEQAAKAEAERAAAEKAAAELAKLKTVKQYADPYLCRTRNGAFRKTRACPIGRTWINTFCRSWAAS